MRGATKYLWAPGPAPRLHPLDRDHAAHLLERAHQRFELADVAGHEGEDVAGQAVPAGATVGLADVDLLLAEGLADVGEDAGGVLGVDAQGDGAGDLGVGAPADLDAALGVGVEGFGALAA